MTDSRKCPICGLSGKEKERVHRMIANIDLEALERELLEND